jgi:hypothetical protein
MFSWLTWGCFLKHRPRYFSGVWDPSAPLRAEVSFNLPLEILKMVAFKAERKLSDLGDFPGHFVYVLCQIGGFQLTLGVILDFSKH